MTNEYHDIFIQIASKYRMNVLMNNPPYVHLRFLNDGLGWFDIMSYPGCLVYRSTDGDYLFNGATDMFGLFDTGIGDEVARIGLLADKVLASGFNSQVVAFSNEKAGALFSKNLETYIADKSISDSDATALREELKDFINRSFATSGTELAARLGSSCSSEMMSFMDDYLGGDWGSLDEISSAGDYTGKFRFACYAIIYAVREYRAIKQSDRGCEFHD